MEWVSIRERKPEPLAQDLLLWDVHRNGDGTDESFAIVGWCDVDGKIRAYDEVFNEGMKVSHWMQIERP